jgi:hypothetical protein
MKSIFLACALALPVASIHHADGWSEKKERIRNYQINRFIKRLRYDMPGYEIQIIEKGPPEGKGWEKVDILYEDYEVYRRPKKSTDFGGFDSPDSREAFLEEYRWIHDFLEKQYPNHEFLIISHELVYQPPPGWTLIVHIVWNGYRIYRRPKTIFPANESIRSAA